MPLNSLQINPIQDEVVLTQYYNMQRCAPTRQGTIFS